MKPRFFKPGYLLWVIVPAGLWLTYIFIGLPHVIWSYSWIDQGQGADPFANRHYTECRFVGPYGQFERPAKDGRCAWLLFFKEEAR